MFTSVQNRWWLGQVCVAVKKWESCIYFQGKLHLCAVSCIFAHIWLQKTWHNLFSFARIWPKAKIFRTSTSNWVRALSYLGGVVKLCHRINNIETQLIRHIALFHAIKEDRTKLKQFYSILFYLHLHFAQYLIKIAVKSERKNRKSCNVKFLETAQNIELHVFWVFRKP